MGAQRIVAAVAVLAVAVLLGWLWLQPGERARGLAPGAEDAAPPQAAETTLGAPPEAATATEPAPAREAAPVESQESASVEPAAGKRTLHVLVLSAEGELPIAGARVTAFEDPPPPPAETDAGGRGELQVAPSAETIRLRVEKQGFFHLSANYGRQEELTLRLAPAVAISGRVLAAESGAPIPGARVRSVHGWCKGCEPDIALAGPDGRFELAGTARGRSTTFLLDAEGFAHQSRMLEIRAEGPRVEVDFQLERGVEVEGRVVDFASGAGIAGVKVGELLTDPTGAFRGHMLPDEGESTVRVRVEAAGYCMLVGTLDLEHAADSIELRVPRGTIVEGVVEDERGEPVPSALLVLDEDWRAHDAGAAPPEPSPLALPAVWQVESEGYRCSAKADANGRFRIENAVPWSTFMELRCFASGYADAARAFERLRGPGESTRVELVLARTQPTATVRGEIWLNGQPLRSAQGRVHWKGPAREGEEEFDSGDFWVEVEPGEAVFRVEVAGLPADVQGGELAVQVEPTGPDERTSLRFDLRMPARAITGRVTFQDGGAAVGASVDASFGAREDAGYWDRLHVSTRTAADGSYELEVPDGEQSYRVEASLDNDERSIEGVRAGASGVDLVLTRAGALLFRFRDARSEVLLEANGFVLGWKRVAEDDFHSLYLGWPLAPDPDGWYEQRLPGGCLDLRASEQWQRAGYLPALLENVLVQPQESLRVEFLMVLGEVVELRLAPEEERLPDDHQVVFVEAELREDVQRRSERNWDAGRLGDALLNRFVCFGEEGSATIRGLAPGRYRFKVFPGDLAIEPAEVVVGTEPREPVLLRWNWLRWTIRGGR